uniref:10-hydroxycamptothecin O-methyltransferase n=1 Tax=Camptotheca acuminata TaxID=16922 RepID=A0A2S1PV97_CAMAC|nr:10-hydroxycamptothecin O-methyltransferase [Camptotheca acuminata]
MANDERYTELLEAQTHLWSQICNLINSASLKCAVELGIPDVIHSHGKPMTLPELVSALPINPSKAHYIYRLMRTLVHSGFFVQQKEGTNEQENGGYLLTRVSRLLLKDEPLNARAFLLAVVDPIMRKPWYFLSDWFKNDDPTAFETAHGRSFWDYLAQEPRLGNFFDEAMASDSCLITNVLINECKEVFEGLTSLVDVGGGTGTVGRAIAKTFPHLKCTVFDLPHVIADLQGTENLDFVGGDMFEAIPPANAILLKWILHNWTEEECVKILKRCKEAIPSKDGGKVIIIDMIMEKVKADDESVEAQLSSDMTMMVLFRAQERSEKEWEKLFLAAGFSHYKITSALGLRSIIEVYP